MSEESATVTLVNQRGLHARASAKFVTFVSELKDGISVDVEKAGTRVNAKSIMGLMMLGAAKGDAITIHVSGDDEQRVANVLNRLTGLVKDGFGED